MGSGFGEPGGTPPPITPRCTPPGEILSNHDGDSSENVT